MLRSPGGEDRYCPRGSQLLRPIQGRPLSRDVPGWFIPAKDVHGWVIPVMNGMIFWLVHATWTSQGRPQAVARKQKKFYIREEVKGKVGQCLPTIPGTTSFWNAGWLWFGGFLLPKRHRSCWNYIKKRDLLETHRSALLWMDSRGKIYNFLYTPLY